MLNKKSKIVLSTTLLILGVSAITYFAFIKPSNMKAKETMAVATIPEKEQVKPTTTPESTSIPKEEPTTTPVATPDNSDKVTTPSDNSNTSSSPKPTTSTSTGTKSGTTSGSGSTSGSTGGTSGGSTGGSTSGGTTTTPTNPPTTTPTNPPTTTPTNPPTTPTNPEPPKYTPSYTLRDDLATEIFNAVSKYRQDNGLGALTRVSSYNSIAQNYLSYRIDAQPKPDITQVYAHYTSQEGGWSADALAGVIGRADRWQGTNTCSVKVAQKGDNYYVCFTVQK